MITIIIIVRITSNNIVCLKNNINNLYLNMYKYNTIIDYKSSATEC